MHFRVIANFLQFNKNSIKAYCTGEIHFRVLFKAGNEQNHIYNDNSMKYKCP